MKEERTATKSQHDVTDFELIVDGTNVSRQYQILSIAVNSEANAIASAKIILRDGDASAEKFAVSESATFIPGKSVTLKLGDDQKKKNVFKGIIVGQSIRAQNQENSLLIVECRHKAFRMTMGRKNKYFEQQKDSDIIESILGQYGLKGDVEPSNVQHKEVVQYHCTDWDFMLMRAESNGKLVFCEEDKIHVHKPDTSSKASKKLLYGENLLDFDAEMDARTQWKNVKGSAWDYTGQQLFEAESASASFTEAGNLSGATLADTGNLSDFELRHTGHVLQEELKAWTDTTMLKSRMAKIRGRARIKGDGDIMPGSVVTLGGCGARFNGKVYVTGVRHEVMSGSWFTHIQFGLSPDWFFQKPDIAPPQAGGHLPPIHGLQIGIAVQLKDSDGEDRILVKLPTLDNQAKGIWARVCTLDAGNERGSFFRPEIGDEVIVGFLNDDPRDAIVLGMLNSSAKPAPWPGNDDNHIKGWQTRSKMKLFFDDEKIVATLITPGENKIIVSDDQKSITLEDQHGNSIVMNDQGIQIKSVKDLKIEAAQNIEIKAGTSLKAEGGTSADLKAGTQLTAKGGAGAEFSSASTTILKGSMVQIN